MSGTISIIASPLANDKTKGKLFDLIKQASEAKQLRRGVKEVTKALRKGEEGLCVIGGDVSPIDVFTHIPVLCEDKDVPYIYVPSRKELGTVANTKRATTLVLIRAPEKGASYRSAYDKARKLIASAQPAI
eukprot:TRINITY_DN2169_c0_g1_i2.p1 TRINITY_DN2169_c0_g1~~TRINITY_DN2169_c0_g1_i2.p1  ORF type:complete len:145 (-),score=53.57 TRINITY_DN2169_c0_g1_i2:104-496(-)